MTSSIHVPDTITKLSPSDTYPIVNGVDVGGFVDLSNKVDSNTAKIEANITNIANLAKAGKTTVVSNIGDNTPVFDTEQHGNYLLIQSGQAGTVTVNTPDPIGGMVDGAIFTIYNESNTQPIRLTPGDPKDTVNGGSAFTIPAENFVSFVYQLHSRDFLQLESGYIPASRINVANYVAQKLMDDGKLHTLADLDAAGYMKNFKVSGDSLSQVTGVNWLHFANATVAPGKQGQAVVTVQGGGGGGSGLAFDDGFTSVSSVTKVTMEGIDILKTGTPSGLAPGEILIASGMDIHMMPPDAMVGMKNAGEIIVLPPLEVVADSSGTPPKRAVHLGVTPGYFERALAPGYLAYLNEPLAITGKREPGEIVHDGQIWFDDVVVPNGTFIPIDLAKKEIGLQDINVGDDPNLSGGTDWLVAYRIALQGVAPDDGYVRIFLMDPAEYGQSANYVTDKNGTPFVAERRYKKGEELGVLEIVGVVEAQGVRNFTMHVVDDFDSDILYIEGRTEGASGIMLQALSKSSKTGPALLQYQSDTNQNIEFSSHYLGAARSSLTWLISQLPSPATGLAGSTAFLPDGWGLNAITDVNSGRMGDHLHISDSGTICDFNFYKIFSGQETGMLRLKDVMLTVTSQGKNNAFRVALIKWTGAPDKFTTKLFTTRVTDVPKMEDGWAIVDSLFIAADPSDGDHTTSKVFTVPLDAANYGFMVYPVQSQTPVSLQLKQLQVDVIEPFTGYIMHKAEHVGEVTFKYSNELAEFRQDNQVFDSLRYTINNVPVEGKPMPCGVKSNGAAAVSIDPKVNVIVGSQATGGEGAIQFDFEGTATVNAMVRLSTDNVAGKDAVVDFWWSSVGSDGSLTKIPDSVSTTIVPGGTSGMQFRMKPFTLDVKEGQRIALRASSDMDDGAYIMSTSPSQPLLDLFINCKGLIASDPVVDPFFGINLSQFTQVHRNSLTVVKDVTNAASVTFNIDVPDTVNLVVLGAIKETEDLAIRPVTKLDWEYSNKAKTLKVSFGETVALGRITIGLFV